MAPPSQIVAPPAWNHIEQANEFVLPFNLMLASPLQLEKHAVATIEGATCEEKFSRCQLIIRNVYRCIFRLL